MRPRALRRAVLSLAATIILAGTAIGWAFQADVLPDEPGWLPTGSVVIR